MLSKLAKIANRLDSIGLTKEADVLDAFIRKVAGDLDGTNFDTETTDPNALNFGQLTTDVNKADSDAKIEALAEKIADSIGAESPTISESEFAREFSRRFNGNAARPTYSASWEQTGRTKAKEQWQRLLGTLQSRVSPSDKSNSSALAGWSLYTDKLGYVGEQVKKAWEDYARVATPMVSPSFSSFTSWYNKSYNDSGKWNKKHKSPYEVIVILGDEADKSFQASVINPWGSGSGSAQAARPSPDDLNSVNINMTHEQRDAALRSINPGEGRLGDSVLGIPR
jgi:hypothetical protein